MPRFIIIDDHTGYIWGDTADLPAAVLADSRDGGFDPNGRQSDENAIAACRSLDWHLGRHDADELDYVAVARLDGRSGYRVYLDDSTSDAVANIQDGQDAEMIEAVKRECRFWTAVSTERKGV